MTPSQNRPWLEAAQVYRNRRVLSMLFLGFASGLPFGILADPFVAWLAESGLSKTDIGLFVLVSLPYSLKFIWAPLMDRLDLPLLTRLLGRRRGWALLTQSTLLLCIWAMGMTNPFIDPWWTGLFALSIAFSSASQDIVIDAYRVEILNDKQLAAGAATATFGWRLAQVGGGALGLIAADLMPWPTVFSGLALLIGIGMVTILVNPEPRRIETDESRDLESKVDQFLEQRQHLPQSVANPMAWIYASYIGPLSEFARRSHWWAILLFILFYKFGDAVLGVMQIPFFLELGFSKTEIAEIRKIFGLAALTLGAFLGGWLLARTGILRGLLICGVLMGLSNLIFVVQAWVGYDPGMLMVTVAVENITTGMGTTAFIAYLSSLCNVAYTATQYALLTSIMAASRTTMSSGAGWLADQTDWSTFFVITTLAAIPGIVLLLWLMRRLEPANTDQSFTQ